MRLVICWSDISGYMAACWRELASLPDVELLVLAYGRSAGDTNAPFDQDQVMRGIKWCPLLEHERFDPEHVGELVEEFRPDAVAICGWFNPAYVALRKRPALQNCRFALGVDTPWRGDWRQRLAPFRVGGYVRSFDAVVVAGERTFQYMRYLGVPEGRLVRGVYGCDAAAFAAARQPQLDAGEPWPKRFLYVGRYVEVKGIDTLLAGYAAYRRQVQDPWPLTCTGRGPLGEAVKAAEGVTDRGFVQPAEQPELFARHGAFVICSRYEPWGVVVAEAMASGMPVIATEAVCAAVDLVKGHYTGLTVATGNANAVAAGLRWVHEQHDDLAATAGRRQTFAGAFGAEVWAERWAGALSPG